MAIVNSVDINRCYTETIASYLRDGYIISPMTTGGSYSNTVCHTDLYNPNEKDKLIRVWMMDRTERTSDEDLFVQTLEVCAKKYRFDCVVPMRSQTLWPDSECAEVVGKSYKFYLISDKKGHYTYTDNKEELRACRQLNWERYNSRSVYSLTNRVRGLTSTHIVPLDKLTPKFVDDIMSRVNSTRGYKRANSSCITEVKVWKEGDVGRMRATVRIAYNNKVNYIHLK